MSFILETLYPKHKHNYLSLYCYKYTCMHIGSVLQTALPLFTKVFSQLVTWLHTTHSFPHSLTSPLHFLHTCLHNQRNVMSLSPAGWTSPLHLYTCTCIIILPYTQKCSMKSRLSLPLIHFILIHLESTVPIAKWQVSLPPKKHILGWSNRYTDR